MRVSDQDVRGNRAALHAVRKCGCCGSVEGESHVGRGERAGAARPCNRDHESCGNGCVEHRPHHDGDTDGAAHRGNGGAEGEHIERVADLRGEALAGLEQSARREGATVLGKRGTAARFGAAELTHETAHRRGTAGCAHLISERVHPLIPVADGVQANDCLPVLDGQEVLEHVREAVGVRARDRGVRIADTDQHAVGHVPDTDVARRAPRSRHLERAHHVRTEVGLQGDEALDAVSVCAEHLHDRLGDRYRAVGVDRCEHIE